MQQGLFIFEEPATNSKRVRVYQCCCSFGSRILGVVLPVLLRERRKLAEYGVMRGHTYM